MIRSQENLSTVVACLTIQMKESRPANGQHEDLKIMIEYNNLKVQIQKLKLNYSDHY